MFESVRARLTLWYVSALALILLVFGIAVYVMLSRALHRRVVKHYARLSKSRSHR